MLQLCIMKQLILLLMIHQQQSIKKTMKNFNNEIHNDVGGSEKFSVESIIDIIARKILEFNGINNDIVSVNVSTADCPARYDISMLQ